jgi:hypothetical protein
MYQEPEKRNDEQIQNAIKNQFLGIAPERKDELGQLWETYNPEFSLLADDTECS